MPIKSPVTYSNTSTLVDEFPSTEIIGLYTEHGIDVSRFFDGINTVKLYECEKTGYRFFMPETLFGDDAFYQDLYQKIPGYYYVNRWEHQKSLEILKGEHLLEVGCGDGYFLNLVKKNFSTVKGLEMNTNAIKAATQKGLDVQSTTIQEFSKQASNQFDVVCCFQVLEHIYDIHSFVEAMIKCLKINGTLIIAVPNNNPYLYKREKKFFLNLPPHHAGLWNKESLSKLSEVFPLTAPNIFYEPLMEPKMWYKAQVDYYKKTNPLVALPLRLIPRQIYKPILRLFKNKIQGKTIMAVYQKKESL